jgi:hypothetical protein
MSEEATQSSGATIVIDDVSGPLPLTATVESPGGYLKITMSGSGSGNPQLSPPYAVGMGLEIDSQEVGMAKITTNNTETHFFSCTFTHIVPAGQHTWAIFAFGDTITAANDAFTVSFVPVPK